MSEGPRREKNSEKSHDTTHFKDIMDIGTIILVIGLVEMLKFLYKNGDLGGLNIPIFSPASACLGA